MKNTIALFAASLASTVKRQSSNILALLAFMFIAITTAAQVHAAPLTTGLVETEVGNAATAALAVLGACLAVWAAFTLAKILRRGLNKV